MSPYALIKRTGDRSVISSSLRHLGHVICCPMIGVPLKGMSSEHVGQSACINFTIDLEIKA